MKKTTYALLFFLFLSFSVTAQLRVNTTGGYFLNAGDFNGYSVGGYALDANIRFGAKNSLQWGFGTGYYRTANNVSLVFNNNPNDYISVDYVVTYIPVTIGFEKYLSNTRLRAFTGMEGGIILPSLSFERNSQTPPQATITTSFNGGQSVNFTASGIFGVLYDINEHIGFVAKTRYSGILDQNEGYTNAITFSVGLSFVVGK
jgi:hypothetical protein